MAITRRLKQETPLQYGQVFWDAETVAYTAGSYVPSDGGVIDGIYVGGVGDVQIVTLGGNTVTYKACPVGTFIPQGCSSIVQAGTTATLLLAGFS